MKTSQIYDLNTNERQVLKTEAQIKAWLDEMEITDYTINPDLTVDVNGNVYLWHKNLVYIPIQFGQVSGHFYCNDNQLKSLEGSPTQMTKSFDCSKNQLQSLAYGPKTTQGFNCSSNQLTSLEHSPELVDGNFNCSFNQLTSLKFLSPIIRDSLDANSNQITHLKDIEHCKIRRIINVNNNKITSLDGLDKVLRHGFSATHNLLTNLEGSPEVAHDSFNCSHNQLTSLKGGPKKTWGTFDVSFNQLTNLEYMPLEIEGEFNASYNQINQITDLKTCTLIHSIILSHNKITQLKGCIDSIRRDFNVSYNLLTDLVGGPKEVGDNYYCAHNQLVSLEGLAKKFTSLMAEHNQISDLSEIKGASIFALDLSNNHITELKDLMFIKKIEFVHIEGNLSIPIEEYIHLLNFKSFIFNDPLNHGEKRAFYNNEDVKQYMEKIQTYMEREHLNTDMLHPHLNSSGKKIKI
jgi:hypothetical protein